MRMSSRLLLLSLIKVRRMLTRLLSQGVDTG
jgi:hypothetical protein